MNEQINESNWHIQIFESFCMQMTLLGWSYFELYLVNDHKQAFLCSKYFNKNLIKK